MPALVLEWCMELGFLGGAKHAGRGPLRAVSWVGCVTRPLLTIYVWIGKTQSDAVARRPGINLHGIARAASWASKAVD